MNTRGFVEEYSRAKAIMLAKKEQQREQTQKIVEQWNDHFQKLIEEAQ
jgi:hypothetical protein